MLPTIPKEQRSRVAHFLEKQNYAKQAMAVTCDPEHKFDLAIQLADIPIAFDLATEANVSFTVCNFILFQLCFKY